MASQRPGVEFLNHLITKWTSDLPLVASEEAVVSRNFMQGSDVDKFGNQLIIRKISAMVASTLGASGDPEALTFSTATEPISTASPTFAYAAISLGISALTRAGAWPDKSKYFNAYRLQIGAAVAAKRDVDSGVLTASLSNTRGSAADNFSKALLLDAYTVLVAASKNHVTINRETGEAQKQTKYLKYHTNQLKHILNIMEITAANVSGNTDKPNVKGVVWNGYGMELADSGNIYVTGGAAYNLLHLPTSHVLGFNQPFMFLPEQPFQAAYRIIGFEEYGVGEVFDEDAVAILTSSTG